MIYRRGAECKQKEAFDFLKTLLNWRKDNEVIHQGKLKHFIPENNIYVYFRYLDERSVMVIINANDSEKVLDTKPFNESLQEFKIGRDVITPVSIFHFLPGPFLFMNSSKKIHTQF